MTPTTEIRGRTMPGGPQRTAPTDVSAYVLAALDEHLATLHRIRQDMRATGTIGPGSRRTLALDSAAQAARFADAVRQVLAEALDGPPGDGHDPRR